MKTIFTTGFAARDRFWMGQQMSSRALDMEIDNFNSISAWLAKTADPKAALGTDYGPFQASFDQSKAKFDDAVGIAEKIHSGQTLSDDEIATVNAFVAATDAAWNIIQMHPTPASTTTPPIQTTGPQATAQQMQAQFGQAAQAIKNALMPAKPAPPVAPPPPAPAASTNQTALIAVGLGAAALIAIVALA